MGISRDLTTTLKIDSIRQEVKEIRESFVGEPNTHTTWYAIEAKIHDFFEQLFTDCDITDYHLVCDSTNNIAFLTNYNTVVVTAYVVRDNKVFDVGGITGSDAWEEAMAKAGESFQPRYFD